MKRKAWVILALGLIVLGLTSLTEYLFYRQEENTWVRRFEMRLHREEMKAVIREEIAHRGVSVIIPRRECIQTAKRHNAAKK